LENPALSAGKKPQNVIKITNYKTLGKIQHTSFYIYFYGLSHSKNERAGLPV